MSSAKMAAIFLQGETRQGQVNMTVKVSCAFEFIFIFSTKRHHNLVMNLFGKNNIFTRIPFLVVIP